MKQITCFLSQGTFADTRQTIAEFRKSAAVSKIVLVCTEVPAEHFEGTEILLAGSLVSGKTIRRIAEISDTEFTLIYTGNAALNPGQLALERFARVVVDTQAGMVYSNYRAVKNGKVENMPVIDYQEGSLRDDFNFGSVLFYNAAMLRKAVEANNKDYQFAGLNFFSDQRIIRMFRSDTLYTVKFKPPIF